MSFTSSTPSDVPVHSTATSTSSSFSSPFTLSPAPLSPPSSSSLKHLLRPSLTISYSQPPPTRMEPPAIVHMTPDPKLPTSVSSFSYHQRPRASTKSSMSISTPPTTTAVVANNSMNAQESSSSKNVPKQQFVAPAHPQSHHLHSLPPREKTTRTLILDHTAWRHGRTRFAQGRCELGMRVRIKGKEEGDFQQAADEANVKRPAFYIGKSNSQSNGGASVSFSPRRRRYSDFGELPEVDVMSSDDDDDEDMDSGEEGLGALSYGKRYRERKKRRQGSLQTASRMQVDTDGEDDSALDDYDDSDNRHSLSSMLHQDARFAPLFAARANGMEKVLCSILREAPSPPLPRPFTPPPYSIQVPYTNTQHSFQSTTEASRVLPNGLRLRLALLELINDLFERQGSASYEQSAKDNSNSNTTASNNESKKPASPSLGLNIPPAGLVALVQVSNQPFFAPPTLPSFRTLSLPSSSMASQNRPSLSSYAPFGGSGSSSRSIPPPVFSWTRTSNTPPTPTSLNTQIRDKDIESSTGGSSSATSPLEKAPSRCSPITLRGPAPDLPASWTDQVPKAVVTSGMVISPTTSLLRRASGRAKDLYAAGCYSTPSSTPNIQTFRTDIPTFSYRGNVVTATTSTPGYSFEKLKTLCPRHLHQQCRVCEPGSSSSSLEGSSSSFPATSRIGAGLMKKHGLLRERGGGVGGGGGHGVLGDQSGPGCSSGSVLADLLPRFLRLSALVAIELGREARGEEPEARDGQEESDIISEPAVDPTVPTNNIDNRTSSSSSVPFSSSSHAQPTRAWFALLCGLITRAVLEGYVARGWKGADHIEILMGIGLGVKGVGTRRQSSGIGDFRDDNLLGQNISTVEDPQDEFDPDEMPGLVDACKILFNGLVRDAALPADSNDKTTGVAEQEYVQEMEERMSEFKFLAVSHPCPDLATHLTQLSEKYPAEPVERSALRFCEAIATWRGKPELEMYKKIFVRRSNTSTPALPIHALLASPAPHKPPIQRYFTVPFSARKPTSSNTRGLKRQRSLDEEVRELKKERYETRHSMDVDSNRESSAIVNANGIVEDLPSADWVGPYGV